jgi:hypothetical protein
MNSANWLCDYQKRSNSSTKAIPTSRVHGKVFATLGWPDATWGVARSKKAGQDSPIWCNVVNIKRHDEMKAKKMKAPGTAQVRASISFPPDVYETLESIAKGKKVSLAWVVREATEQYIADKWPLLKGMG